MFREFYLRIFFLSETGINMTLLRYFFVTLHVAFSYEDKR